MCPLAAYKFVTPSQRHRGEDKAILENRKQVYMLAQTRKPARWSRDIRNWERVENVSLNPEKPDVKNAVKIAA